MYLNFSVYSGHHSILIPPSEIEINPGLWLTAVSQYQVRDTFCSYGKYSCIYLNTHEYYSTPKLKIYSSHYRCNGVMH